MACIGFKRKVKIKRQVIAESWFSLRRFSFRMKRLANWLRRLRLKRRSIGNKLIQFLTWILIKMLLKISGSKKLNQKRSKSIRIILRSRLLRNSGLRDKWIWLIKIGQFRLIKIRLSLHLKRIQKLILILAKWILAKTIWNNKWRKTWN